VSARSQSLDVLRGLAVLSVIVGHYGYIAKFEGGGILGVDLFFVLSGFLISGLLYRELISQGKISVGRFVIRRGFKIYPAFYVFLGLTLLISPGFRHSHELLSESLFLQSYLPRFWGHTWSLAVEEHFYLALPPLLIALHRFKRLHWIPVISASLVAGCLVLRLITAVHSDNMESVLTPSHLRADALFFGVALGYFYHYKRQEFLDASRWWTAPIGVILLLPALLTFHEGTMARSIHFSFNLAGCGLLLLWALPRHPRLPPLAEIGKYSYSIYLWHMLVTGFFRQLPCTPLLFIADVAMCLAIGVAMSVMIEMPLLSLRERLFPSIDQRPHKSMQPALGRTAPLEA